MGRLQGQTAGHFLEEHDSQKGRIRRVFKIDVFSNTCVFSKRVRFLTFDNAAENQNYSLNSCRVKVFQRTGNTHSELQHHCSCRGTCIRAGGSDL